MPYKDKESFDAYRERTKERRRAVFAEWESRHRAERNEYRRELRAKTPCKLSVAEREKRNAYNRAWRAANREKNRAYHAAWRARNPQHREQGLARLRERDYGVTPEQFASMVHRQGGKCAICGESPKGSFHVDHDHVSGAVRDLLCGTCNRGLGMYRDDPALLTKAAWYLERHRASHRRSA